MLHLQLLVMLAARVCAKRKLKVRGKVKWFSLVDILLVQNTYDPIYWAAWILWCFWWDIFDRKCYKTAAGVGWTIAALRTVFILKTHIWIYIPAVLSSMGMTYFALYTKLFKT